jgi:hypothetical protein
VTAPAAAGVEELISFALAALEPMQLPGGAVCHEMVAGDPAPHGVSLRYTAMTYIGLLRAEGAGYEHRLDRDGMAAALHAGAGSADLEPGDYGLYLWADALTGRERGDDLLARLEAALAARGGLLPREGMELAWIVQGLALQVEAKAGERAARLLAQALDHLLARREPASGLFLHYGTGPRRRFPNFATQIYSVLALATVARTDRERGAVAAAAGARAADRLIELQVGDGGWPWLFDARRGTVVERYEVYSVHQDAMAPMGLLALTEATGERAYADAAVRGLAWVHGRNELGVPMLDREAGMLYRSIRRRRPLDRLAIYANTAGSLLGGVRPARPGGPLEVNRTDRPYHLGWILEAWCGRESFAGSAG